MLHYHRCILKNILSVPTTLLFIFHILYSSSIESYISGDLKVGCGWNIERTWFNVHKSPCMVVDTFITAYILRMCVCVCKIFLTFQCIPTIFSPYYKVYGNASHNASYIHNMDGYRKYTFLPMLLFHYFLKIYL